MKTRAMPFKDFVLQKDPIWKIKFNELNDEERISLLLTLLIRFNFRTVRDACHVIGIIPMGFYLQAEGWLYSRQAEYISEDEVRIRYVLDQRNLPYIQDRLSEVEKEYLIEEY